MRINHPNSGNFDHFNKEEFLQIIHRLGTMTKTFPAGSTILQYHESHRLSGILLTGAAAMIRYETNGTRTILDQLSPPDIFGELTGFRSCEPENLSLICSTECTVVFFDCQRVISPCKKSCPEHTLLIRNMLAALSGKVESLSFRVELLSKRTIRDKLLFYFQHLIAGSSDSYVIIPFTMSDLADYLCADRSAMTREIKKMKAEGWITLEKYRLTPGKLFPYLNSSV